jgi:hypothetical protein
VDPEVVAVGRLAVREAEVPAERIEAVLQPAEPDLLESPILDPVDPLADHRVLVRSREPVEPDVADVARRRAD